MTVRKSDHDRWLSEAAIALADAERLTGILMFSHPRQDLTLAALQAEIISVRHEVERLQRERAGEGRREFNPDWMEYSVWHP